MLSFMVNMIFALSLHMTAKMWTIRRNCPVMVTNCKIVLLWWQIVKLSLKVAKCFSKTSRSFCKHWLIVEYQQWTNASNGQLPVWTNAGNRHILVWMKKYYKGTIMPVRDKCRSGAKVSNGQRPVRDRMPVRDKCQ